MADIRSKLGELYSLEQLSSGKSAVHRRHPLSKMAVTAVYLLCVMSFDSYTLGRLAPYLFYPFILMAAAEVPYRMVFRRTLVALPFCLFAGITNLLLNRTTAFSFLGVPVSLGFLSLCSIVARTFLCVSAVLILVAVTPFSALTDQLRRMHVPGLLVSLFEMVYRYISVLLEEASDMVTAYCLRCPGAKWPSIRHFGSFVGMLLIRSFDRAERVYQAMQCRLYALYTVRKAPMPFQGADWAFLLSGCGLSLLFRWVDAPALLGGLLT